MLLGFYFFLCGGNLIVISIRFLNIKENLLFFSRFIFILELILLSLILLCGYF